MGKNTLVVQTIIVGVGACSGVRVCVLGQGGAGEEEQDIREQCLTLRGQLLSRLAKYRPVCFGVGRFFIRRCVLFVCA